MEVAEGLWLEDRRVRLAWGMTPDELRARTAPNFVTDHPAVGRGSAVLVWNDRVWGGLGCQVRAEFGDTHWPQDALRWVHLVLRPPPGVRPLHDAFARSQRVLAERFGPPDAVSDNGEEGRAVWQFGRVSLRDQYFDGFCGYHEVLLFVS